MLGKLSTGVIPLIASKQNASGKTVVVCGSSLFDRTCLSLLKTLSAIHDLGWLHGDLRPSNLAIDATGKARIFDFSYACEKLEEEADSELEEFRQMLNQMEY
jgi:serine/threonine protein kinase